MTTAMIAPRRGALAALVIAAFLVSPAGALARPEAESSSRADEKVEVQVLVIRATTANKEVDKELRDIAEQLRKHGKYTGFKLEKKLQKSVEVGKAAEFSLGHDFAATITPQKRDGERITLRVESSRTVDGKKKPHPQVTFTQDRGKSQPMGGWKISADSEDAMILAISAR